MLTQFSRRPGTGALAPGAEWGSDRRSACSCRSLANSRGAGGRRELRTAYRSPLGSFDPRERRIRVSSGCVSVPYPPIEPPKTAIAFPDPRRLGRREVVAVGEDFRPYTILEAYRRGVFPWPHTSPTGDPMVLWFSPNPRAIFPLEETPHWSRSLRRTRLRTLRATQLRTASRQHDEPR